MRVSYKRVGVIVGFCLLLTLLLLNAAVTRRKLSQQVGAESWVSHTQEVQLELNQLELLVVDAETGQRGYLYTGDKRYLLPYQNAISKIDPQIDSIAKLTADNPRQQAMLPELRARVHAKVEELAQVIALQQSGRPQQARDLVLTSTGLLLMEQIRSAVSQMQGEESHLQSERVEAYENSIQETIVSLYIANLMAVVGLVLLAYYILREMDAREKHDHEIRVREEWFRTTLTSIGDAVIATDRNGNVTFLNPVAENLIGLDLTEGRGRSVQEVFPIINEYTLKPAENPVDKVLEKGFVVGLANHTALVRKDGTHVPIEDSAAPIRDESGDLMGVVLVFRDVTNDRRTQEAMRRTERLAAAARLAATMAHEINNPLQAVTSLVYLSRQAPDAPEAIVSQLTLAEQELQRVAHIAQQTLGFYRESGVTGPIDMREVVDAVLEIYSNKLKSKDVRIVRNFGDYPHIHAATGEMRQVISNLLVNAVDAVNDGGTVTITLGGTVNAGQNMLHLLVEDDGPGIPPEYKPHMFEPFITTKKDVGTGLGLWLSKEIVERYNGTIEVVPRANGRRGAAFSILLPASQD